MSCPVIPVIAAFRSRPDGILFDLCRFTEIFGAMGLSATGEAVITRVSGDPGDLVEHAVAAQHAQMSVMIGAAGTFRPVFHDDSTFLICDPAS